MQLIDYRDLTADALTSVIDEFVTRDGVDWDAPLERKRERVLGYLKRKEAVISYNDKSKSTHILLRSEFDRIQAEQSQAD